LVAGHGFFPRVGSVEKGGSEGGTGKSFQPEKAKGGASEGVIYPSPRRKGYRRRRKSFPFRLMRERGEEQWGKERDGWTFPSPLEGEDKKRYEEKNCTHGPSIFGEVGKKGGEKKGKE